MQEREKKKVLMDDGDWYIEHEILQSFHQGGGFLLRRCPIKLQTPGGYECIGRYELRIGKWVAWIDVPYDDEKDSDILPLGRFDTRDEAIAVLWLRRKEALCRHQSEERKDRAGQGKAQNQ